MALHLPFANYEWRVNPSIAGGSVKGLKQVTDTEVHVAQDANGITQYYPLDYNLADGWVLIDADPGWVARVQSWLSANVNLEGAVEPAEAPNSLETSTDTLTPPTE